MYDAEEEAKLKKRINIVDLIRFLLEKPQLSDSDYKIEPEEFRTIIKKIKNFLTQIVIITIL